MDFIGHYLETRHPHRPREQANGNTGENLADTAEALADRLGLTLTALLRHDNEILLRQLVNNTHN